MDKNKSITDKDVKHVAELARISLSDDEVAVYREQFVKILRYIDKLNEVDINNVQPTSHPLEGLKNIFRKDEVRPSLAVESALLNAPGKKGSFFSVPKILEQYAE